MTNLKVTIAVKTDDSNTRNLDHIRARMAFAKDVVVKWRLARWNQEDGLLHGHMEALYPEDSETPTPASDIVSALAYAQALTTEPSSEIVMLHVDATKSDDKVSKVNIMCDRFRKITDKLDIGRGTWNIGFVNEDGNADETQFDLEEEDVFDLYELWAQFCLENHVLPNVVTYVEPGIED